MSKYSASQYDVQKTSGVCASTGDELAPGDTCWSALVDIPVEERDPKDTLGMRRVDVSDAAWEGGFRPERVFSFWKTTVPEPNAKKKTFVDDAMLMNLLRRLEDTDEPRRQSFRFVVSLILMRKKLVRYDGTDTVDDPEGDGPVQQWWRFTPKVDVTKGHFGKWNEDDELRVLDPQLDESQIAEVTEQLGEVLEAEL